MLLNNLQKIRKHVNPDKFNFIVISIVPMEQHDLQLCDDLSSVSETDVTIWACLLRINYVFPHEISSCCKKSFRL